MPNYDFFCDNCGRRSRLFFSFAAYDTAEPACPHCGGKQMRRRIGRVAVAKSDEARADGMMDEAALAGLDADDPREIGRLMRQMSSEMGEDLGDEFGEVVDRLEKGQSPDAIEKAMPDLAAGGDEVD